MNFFSLLPCFQYQARNSKTWTSANRIQHDKFSRQLTINPQHFSNQNLRTIETVFSVSIHKTIRKLLQSKETF